MKNICLNLDTLIENVNAHCTPEIAHKLIGEIENSVDKQQLEKEKSFEHKTAEILEMIAIGEPASKVYDAIALMYEGRHPGLRCSLLELEDGILLHGGAPSMPKEYCEAVHGLKNGPDIGSCGTSTYTGKRCIVENIETDPKWADIKAAALPHGMRSCWSEPVIDSKGKVLGAFGMYHDYPCTPNEEESKDLLSGARITSIVMERDQAHKKLEQLVIKANRSNQIKTEFLANISHELRTPLNGILGYVQILKNDAEQLNNEQSQGLGVIQRSGEHLLTLINDILDLSKIEAGHMELYPVEFQLKTFLTDIINVFKVTAQQKNLALHYKVDNSLPDVVYADEKRLRQVVINLLGNAVKFTSDGEVVLQVAYDQQQQSLSMQVIDTGCGIKQSALQEIFQPFSQVGSILNKAQGTGLGLSVTKSIIEMMQGEIEVESEVNKGSRFSFTIPMKARKTTLPKTASDKHNRIIGYTSANPDIDKYRILITDDVPNNCMVIEKLLQPLGFATATASDGHEAIAQAKTFKPHLVLMDLMMPVLDGFAATEQLHQDPAFQQTPVVAFTASIHSENIAASKAAGCVDILEKPIKQDLLLACIQRHVPLTWQYATASTPTQDAIMATAMGAENEPMVQFNPEQIQALLRLAQAGDIMGLHDYIENLENKTTLRPLLKRIKPLLDKFDDEGIVTLLTSQTQ